MSKLAIGFFGEESISRSIQGTEKSQEIADFLAKEIGQSTEYLSEIVIVGNGDSSGPKEERKLVAEKDFV